MFQGGVTQGPTVSIERGGGSSKVRSCERTESLPKCYSSKNASNQDCIFQILDSAFCILYYIVILSKNPFHPPPLLFLSFSKYLIFYQKRKKPIHLIYNGDQVQYLTITCNASTPPGYTQLRGLISDDRINIAFGILALAMWRIQHRQGRRFQHSCKLF